MAVELISKIALPAQACNLTELRRNVRAVIQNFCHDAEQIDQLVIAINEASMNVIQHAYKNRTDGVIELEIYYNDNLLTFRIIDYADPIDRSALQSPQRDELTPGGLGLQMIREIVDEMHFTNNPDGNGNIMELKVKLKRCESKQ